MRRRVPESAPADLMFHGRRYDTVAAAQAARAKWQERCRRLLALVNADEETPPPGRKR